MSVSDDGAAAALLGPAQLLLLSAPSSNHFSLLLPTVAAPVRPELGRKHFESEERSNKSKLTVQAAESAHIKNTATQLDDIRQEGAGLKDLLPDAAVRQRDTAVV